MTCVCGREVWADIDFIRWKQEEAEWVTSGNDEKKFNPEWAKAICWTKPGMRCVMRPV